GSRARPDFDATTPVTLVPLSLKDALTALRLTFRPSLVTAASSLARSTTGSRAPAGAAWNVVQARKLAATSVHFSLPATRWTSQATLVAMSAALGASPVGPAG